MDFDRLYKLGRARKRTSLHVAPREPDEIDDFAILRGEIRPQKPLVFEYMKGASGSTPRDLVSTSLVSLRLISDRVISVLREFSGWGTYPVEVYGKKGERIPGYHGLAVTGRCGPIDDSRSRPAVYPPAVPQGRPTLVWIGLYFDPETWDGSDVFLPEDSANIFVTEAVKEAFEKAKITNVEFTPLTQVRNYSSKFLLGGDIP